MSRAIIQVITFYIRWQCLSVNSSRRKGTNHQLSTLTSKGIVKTVPSSADVPGKCDTPYIYKILRGWDTDTSQATSDIHYYEVHQGEAKIKKVLINVSR